MSNDQVAKPLIVEIEGEHYEFTPLKVSDIVGPVTDYMKMSPIAALLKQRDAFEPEIFEELMIKAQEESKSVELGTESFSDNVFKPKNVVYIFWLSLRKKHPEIKKIEFDKLLQDNGELIKTLYENFDRIIAFSESQPKDEDSPTREKSGGAKKKTDPST